MFYCHISFVHNIICHAITVLSKNISRRVAYKQTGPWLSLGQPAHVSSDDQGFLIMGKYVNEHRGHVLT
jgi:hypothetical protein